MVQRYNILGRHTNQYSCLCSHAWSVEVCHGKIRMRHMRAHNISRCNELWILGGGVKEKYPNTDKKVVIEFTQKEKEQE